MCPTGQPCLLRPKTWQCQGLKLTKELYARMDVLEASTTFRMQQGHHFVLLPKAWQCQGPTLTTKDIDV
eukprot:1157111-Pelagomonas_calceolata.AAC.7